VLAAFAIGGVLANPAPQDAAAQAAGPIGDILDDISSALLPKYAHLIKEKNLMKTLKDLETIAFANGGNRAFGLPGYKASVDYILKRVAKIPGLTARTQEFSELFAQTTSIKLNVVGEDELYVYGLTYSPSTSAEGIERDVILGPQGLAGCDASGYPDGIAQGKIVLVQRFRCPDQTTLAGLVRAATAAGADAVIIYSDGPTKPTAGTLSAPDPVGYRPAGFIYRDDGLRLAERIAAGENIRMHFQQTQVIEHRPTWNVIAETKWGSDKDVLVMGAHLDSVQAGPGINDDGSGTALILELASSLKLIPTPLKLRFTWWGAEENGLLGSKFYVKDLVEKGELDNVRAYLNFDMVSKGYFGVFDGDGSSHGLAGPPGSGKIEELFHDAMEKLEVPVTPAVFTGGSDYASFMERGVPVGGLHTGTGFEQDPCYHQECDTYSNPNSTVLTVNAKAAASVLAELAFKGKRLIPERNATSTGSLRMRSDGSIEWGLEEGARHTHGCTLEV